MDTYRIHCPFHRIALHSRLDPPARPDDVGIIYVARQIAHVTMPVCNSQDVAGLDKIGIVYVTLPIMIICRGDVST